RIRRDRVECPRLVGHLHPLGLPADDDRTGQGGHRETSRSGAPRTPRGGSTARDPAALGGLPETSPRLDQPRGQPHADHHRPAGPRSAGGGQQRAIRARCEMNVTPPSVEYWLLLPMLIVFGVAAVGVPVEASLP